MKKVIDTQVLEVLASLIRNPEAIEGLSEEVRQAIVESPVETLRRLVLTPQPAPSILELVLGGIIIPATTSGLVAKDKFKLKQDGGICSYLGDNFHEWFLKNDGKVEGPFAGSTLRCHRLLKPATDMPQRVGEPAIIPELGGEAKVETFLSEMFFLMEKQKDGKEGTLLTNGWVNIFYIKDNSGVLRTVSVSWDDDGWHVYADSVGSPHGWNAGRQVFSRNSVLKSSGALAPAQG